VIYIYRECNWMILITWLIFKAHGWMIKNKNLPTRAEREGVSDFAKSVDAKSVNEWRCIGANIC